MRADEQGLSEYICLLHNCCTEEGTEGLKYAEECSRLAFSSGHCGGKTRRRHLDLRINPWEMFNRMISTALRNERYFVVQEEERNVHKILLKGLRLVGDSG